MDKNEKTAKVLGIVSFVLSILGLVCFFIIVFVQISGLWFSFGCAAFSVTALVLGAVSRKKQKNHNAFALIGFIVSIVTIALFVFLWTLLLVLFVFFADVIHLFSGLGRIG